jgi:hypothetical protein
MRCAFEMRTITLPSYCSDRLVHGKLAALSLSIPLEDEVDSCHESLGDVAWRPGRLLRLTLCATVNFTSSAAQVLAGISACPPQYNGRGPDEIGRWQGLKSSALCLVVRITLSRSSAVSNTSITALDACLTSCRPPRPSQPILKAGRIAHCKAHPSLAPFTSLLALEPVDVDLLCETRNRRDRLKLVVH